MRCIEGVFSSNVSFDKGYDSSASSYFQEVTHDGGSNSDDIVVRTLFEQLGLIGKTVYEDSGGNSEFIYEYDYSNGARLKSLTDPDGVKKIFEYNSLNELIRVGFSPDGNSTLSSGSSSDRYM